MIPERSFDEPWIDPSVIPLVHVTIPITAHTNFLLSCNISQYGKGNRSRLTLLQRCSAHTMTCHNQFVRIPLSSSSLTASRAADNFIPPSHSLDQLPILPDLSPRAHVDPSITLYFVLQIISY